jgi:D-alanyl-lipoteichoic acid acyltransferase DltB (MBOAT superfamily)
MFYPQLVAGPIERPQHLLHQFYEHHRFDVERIFSALRLIVWGLFKKAVIADRLSFFVNQIFNNPHSYSGSFFLLAAFFFAFQIYCDFSGYSDMARGLARALGFELMVNFNAPYFAKSVGEFWQRWHISLSTWFRDYVYIPLGGNRVSEIRWQFNIFMTFLLSGIWHGANWTFVVWGGLNGLYLIFPIWLKKLAGLVSLRFWPGRFAGLKALLQTMATFLLVSVSWIFFRASSLSEAAYIFKQIFASGYRLADLQPYIAQYSNPLAVVLGGIIFLTAVDYFAVYKNTPQRPLRVPVIVQTAAFLALVIIILIIGRFTNEQFIYFQF